MLTKILARIRSAHGAVSIRQLSQELQVEPSALEGMLMELVRMGKLEVKTEPTPEGGNCKTCAGCKGTQECPFVFHLPIQYQLTEKNVPAE